MEKINFLLPVFQLLYFVAHFLVSLLQSGYNTFCDLNLYARHFYHWIFRKQSTGIETLCKWRSCPGKVPVHPALVLLPGHFRSHQTPQICRVLASFVHSGAMYLSAYDAAGILHDDKLLIQEELQKMLPNTEVILSYPENGFSLEEDSNADSEDQMVTKRRSSPTAKKKVLLNIQSYETSSKTMIKAVEELSRLPKEQLDEVDVGNVHTLLTSLTYGSSGADPKRPSCNGSQPSCKEEDLVPLSCNGLQPSYKEEDSVPLSCNGSQPSYKEEDLVPLIPDPDLVVVVGDHLTSNGFPCWFLRLSEFISCPSVSRLDVLQIDRILASFSKKEQRYGR